MRNFFFGLNLLFFILIVSIISSFLCFDNFDYDSEAKFDLDKIEDYSSNKADKSHADIEDEYLQRKIEFENQSNRDPDKQNLYSRNPNNNKHNDNKRNYHGASHRNPSIYDNHQADQRVLYKDNDIYGDALGLNLKDSDEMQFNKKDLINDDVMSMKRNSFNGNSNNRNPKYGMHKAGLNDPGQMGHNTIQNQEQNKSGMANWLISNPVLSTIYEGLALVFLAGFVYKCVFMRNTNDKNIAHWYKSNKEILQEKFNKEAFYYFNEEEKKTDTILYSKDEQPRDTMPIYKYTEKFFLYHAEDGENVQSMDIRFEFHKNQDYLFLVTQFIFTEKDRVIYEIILKYEDYYPLLFVLCRPKDTENIAKMNQDIKELCVNKKHYQNFGLECLSEDTELITHILSSEKIRKPLGIFREMLELVLLTEIEGKNK